jgi:tRNA pseudouridine38-40 synthase
MFNYKMTIQYDGGRYKGWQRLGGGENTIQAKIEQVLSEMVGYKLEIIGCSRTDAGVHAIAQIANFKLDNYVPEKEIRSYLGRYLPQDISILEVIMAEESFHSRYLAKDKTYLYKIWNEEYSNPFMRKYSMHVSGLLNVTAMQEASKYFLGEHDFTAFSNAKSKKKSMVRNIRSIDLELEGGFLNIRICGDGFLYNMVRWMVGALVEVGLGNRKPEDITQMLLSKDRNQTGNLADACGLYLEKIRYE